MGSIRNAIEKAKQQMDYFSTDKDYWWESVANEAVKEFNCQETLIKKNETITLDRNGRWFFPRGFYQLICFTGQQQMNNGVVTCVPIIYFEQPFLRSCGINCNTQANFTWLSVQKNHNYFQFFGDFTQFINLRVSYLAYAVDENGTFEIPDDYEEPVSNYLCARWCLKNIRDYSQYQYQAYMDTFFRLKRKVVSESNLIKFRNMKPQILNSMDTTIKGCGYMGSFNGLFF